MLDKEIFQNIGSYVCYPFNIINNRSPETFPLHWHNYIEVIYSHQNFVQYEVNGHLYTLFAGDILFIWSGELHALISQPQPSDVLLVQFDYPIIGDRVDFKDKLSLFHSFHHVSAKDNPELASSIGKRLDNIKELDCGCDGFKEVKMCIEIYELLMELGNSLLDDKLSAAVEKNGKRSESTDRLVSICSYIATHCTEDIKIEEAAKCAGFSISHFSRLFKRFTSDSYNSFVTKCRVHKAEELLTNSNLSITDAAFQSGFNSIATFNRNFQQYKHCSPTQFRNLYRVHPNFEE